MFINTAEEVSGIPASWPRVDLSVGSTGEKVRQIQEQLARISRSYPAIPTITPDRNLRAGKPGRRWSVSKSIFGLPVTGVIDFRTWYRISEDLCRGYAHCGAGLEVGFSPVCDRISYKLGIFWRILWRITG